MADPDVDLPAVARLYGESLARHGHTPMGVGWRTEHSQDLRFERLLAVVDTDSEAPFVVNDLGCGYGALFDFLLRRELPVRRYIGYEISEEMLAAAQSRVPAEQGEIVAADRVTQDADYSVASGIFNVKLNRDDQDWGAYVQDVVRHMARHSRRGFAFNLLTTYCEYREAHLFYGDPLWWFDWCKREITPRVALLHDYPLFEWTLLGRPE